MATQILPTQTDRARYSIDVDLDERTFRLTFEWNDRDSAWYFSIADVNADPIVSGVRVVVGYPLLNRYKDERLPRGILSAYDTSRTDTEPGFADLGERVQLLYYPEADL